MLLKSFFNSKYTFSFQGCLELSEKNAFSALDLKLLHYKSDFGNQRNLRKILGHKPFVEGVVRSGFGRSIQIPILNIDGQYCLTLISWLCQNLGPEHWILGLAIPSSFQDMCSVEEGHIEYEFWKIKTKNLQRWLSTPYLVEVVFSPVMAI